MNDPASHHQHAVGASQHRRAVGASHHQRAVLAAPSTDGRRRSQTLPDEVLARAAIRLRLTGAVALVASLVRMGVPLLSGAGSFFGTPEEVGAKQLVFGATGLLSALVVVLSYLRLSPQRLLFFGQVYFVLMVGLLGAADAASPWTERSFATGLPIPVAIILVFPIMVPMPPRRFVIVALAAIATHPLVSLLVPLVVGHPVPDGPFVLLSGLPLVAASAVAYVTADLIYQLGRDLGRAQKAGSYQLVAPLGKGGMGEVWRARHGLLAREAAIKLIRGDRIGSGEEAVRRFEHEARVVASLRSQHTIQLYDFGVTDDGALYYAMELLDGFDLDRLVREHGPIPAERVVHFLVQACHSLVEAHEAGLVHRDIKPANLFTTRLGRDVDVIKVLDFGLATRPLAERLDDPRATAQGTILGSPAYMAPEQVLGDRAIDGRADLYALGTVAWWLLTGRDPFHATSATQVMFAHVHSEPEPPSAHARHPVPAELDRVILRCLAKRPEDRPQTAEALAEELRAVPLEQPWTRARALAWWSERAPKSPAA